MGPNSITSGMQSSTVSLPQATPGELQNLKELAATNFGFGKDGLEWNAWLDMASRSTNPEIKAQYRELVDLAGGRTDRPSLLKAMELAQAYFNAIREGATANDQRALGHAMERSLFQHFSLFNPTELLTSPLRSAALALLETSGANQTEWGQSLGQAIRMDASFRQGLAEGIWQGGKDMVTGIAWLVGKTLQAGGDASQLGRAGDALRGLTGKMPDWLEAVIPSEARGQQRAQAVGNAMRNAASYIANNSPSEIASDIGDAIGNAWDGLKADHARAAAQGPEAEARWWGQTIGRIGFEVAATFAGGVGVAGKASKGAKAAEGLADVADAANDAARAADKAHELSRRLDEVRAGDGLNDALRVGRFSVDELTSLARAGKLSASEIQDVVLHLGVNTPRDQLILWSGLGRNGQVRAAAYAKEAGGLTLEMTKGGKWLDELKLFEGGAPNISRSTAYEIWEATSDQISKQASGQVRVVVGQISPTSIYARIEKPNLLDNPNVLGIEEIQLKPKIGVQ